MKQFYQIHELAKLFDLCPDTLRYYEEKGLLHPVRGENRYRMYGIQDVCTLNIIRALRELKIPTRAIRTYLERRSVGETLSLLDREEALLRRRMAELEAALEEARARRARLEQYRAADDSCIVTDDYLKGLEEKFGEAAALAKEAGFDAVDIKSCHGYLLAELASAYNRPGEYGGSFENRARWPLSVLKAMRERVGDGLCIDMRISGDELVPGGMGIEETKAFIRLAQEYIDTVHVSQGLIVEPNYMPYTMPAFYLPHCHNVKWSEQVKADPDIHIPVTVVGSITTVAEAEEIIASGKADMVAMARQLMCDNKLLYNAYHGMEEKTRPCLRCHECAPADIVHLRCATNPRLGRESEIPEELPYAKHKKRVVVVGGGVAGCMAAKTLVERGHDVTLIEKSDKLGGRLHEISCLSFKFDMRQHLRWLMSSTMESGAKIMLNTEATAEIIMGLKPDVVFVATGAERLTLPIPGIDRENVHHVLDVGAVVGQADLAVVEDGVEIVGDVGLGGMRPVHFADAHGLAVVGDGQILTFCAQNQGIAVHLPGSAGTLTLAPEAHIPGEALVVLQLQSHVNLHTEQVSQVFHAHFFAAGIYLGQLVSTGRALASAAAGRQSGQHRQGHQEYQYPLLHVHLPFLLFLLKLLSAHLRGTAGRQPDNPKTHHRIRNHQSLPAAWPQ